MNTLSSIEREREEERDTDDKIEIHDGIAAPFYNNTTQYKKSNKLHYAFIHLGQLEVKKKAQKTKVNHMRDERIPH